MDSITLRQALPRVFDGMQGDEAIRASQVWMAELTLIKGQRYLIAAESGAGKSSLCSFLYGNRNDYMGEIYFNSHPIREFTRKQWCEIRQRHVALLPQEMRLFPELTALENVQLKNRLTGRYSEHEILQMLERLEIGWKANEKAGHLSIGQQQRVAVVRTLCQPFDFLLLDEPVSHLDARNNRAVALMVSEVAASQGAGIVSTSVGNPLDLPNCTLIHL
ncbi:MAG: ATP-binding cassette domain-containing protein [Bacteroidales bacterium]|nr:ATP-binding cassette domain-containing protein [Bacteroidales bacterium]